MPEDPIIKRSELLSLASEIVSAHVSNNRVAHNEIAGLIQSAFGALSAVAAGNDAPVELTPAVPIRKSVTDDYIVCLEDGMKLKMLKRHLITAHNMTPEEYRARWHLRPDYPMVAPNYARKRQELAKQSGLGHKPRSTPPSAPKAKPRGSRAKAAA